MTRKDPFSEETIREERTFPKKGLVIILILVAIQIGLVLVCVLYHPKPQDTILDYTLTVEPNPDGSLMAEYTFVWKALDKNEPLTWVEIGMPNSRFTLTGEHSDNISYIWADISYDGGFDYTHIDFARSYRAGEVVAFSFRARLDRLLCHGAGGEKYEYFDETLWKTVTREGNAFFYEFVPGWFNATPVEHYSFRWKADGATAGAPVRDGYYVWEGSLDCGEKVKMTVEYPPDTFDGNNTVFYRPADMSVQNDLLDDKIAVCVLLGIVALLLVIAEVWIIDGFVSYSGGRGFIIIYGHRVHHYGRINPAYRDEAKRRAAASSGSRGGFHGGGCACACACACAGGGRAGCGQKDTTPIHPAGEAADRVAGHK